MATIGLGASADFTAPSLDAKDCSLSLALPKFSFGLILHIPGFPPSIPIPRLRFKLNCDLNNPIDVSASVGPGGGRKPNFDPDPDADDSF